MITPGKALVMWRVVRYGPLWGNQMWPSLEKEKPVLAVSELFCVVSYTYPLLTHTRPGEGCCKLSQRQAWQALARHMYSLPGSRQKDGQASGLEDWDNTPRARVDTRIAKSS